MGLWIASLFFVEMLQSCHFFLFLRSFKQKEKTYLLPLQNYTFLRLPFFRIAPNAILPGISAEHVTRQKLNALKSKSTYEQLLKKANLKSL